jgi:hypothetical protein
VRFPNHAVSNGFNFSRSQSFGNVGSAFVTLFGDLTQATTTGVPAEAGQQVVMVTPQGLMQPFISGLAVDGDMIFRPTDAKFDASGNALYVVHFGQMKGVPGGVAATPATGGRTDQNQPRWGCTRCTVCTGKSHTPISHRYAAHWGTRPAKQRSAACTLGSTGAEFGGYRRILACERPKAQVTC